jgi:hypothetical protein
MIKLAQLLMSSCFRLLNELDELSKDKGYSAAELVGGRISFFEIELNEREDEKLALEISTDIS